MERKAFTSLTEASMRVLLGETHMVGKTVIVNGKKGKVIEQVGSDGKTESDEIYKVKFEDGTVKDIPARDMEMQGDISNRKEPSENEAEDIVNESYDKKGLLKKGLTHAIYSKGPSGQIHFTHRRKKFADFKAKMYTDAIQFNQKDHPGFGVMIVPHGTPNGKSVHKDHEKYYGKADESVELEERKYYRGDIVKGRRGDHADQEYVVHSGNSEENPNSMTVKIGNRKVQVSPHNFNSTGRRKYFPGPKLRIEGAGDASASASETDANRAAYLKQYGAKPEQRERRSARTNARNKLIRRGRASVGDGKDLDHKDGNPLNNSANNLRMVGRNFNRGRDNNKWRKKTNEEHGAGEMGTKKLLKRYIKDTPFMTVNKGKK